jgi:Domain of unknown function (DUF2703)
MTMTDATSESPDVRRTVAIEFLFLDLATCGRCRGTDASIDSALAAIEDVLHATGTRVDLRRIHVRTADQARELRFVSSPTIRVNGRDIALELIESACGEEACGCGQCRVWSYGGREYTEAPVGLIVDAVLGELYAAAPRADVHDAAYQLPKGLERMFAAKDAGVPGGGCCA